MIKTNSNYKSILKYRIKLKLKPLHTLENINIFTIPSFVQEKDIISMFKGVISIMRKKIEQEQIEKFLNLKLKYERLKYLYNKLKEVK